MTFDFGTIVTLLVGIMSSTALLEIIKGCVQRARNQAEAEHVGLDNDVLESKIRTALYGENMILRKDLDEAHEKIRALQRQILQLELTMGDTQKLHIEEMADVTARLKISEERLLHTEAQLAESERARTLIQADHLRHEGI